MSTPSADEKSKKGNKRSAAELSLGEDEVSWLVVSHALGCPLNYHATPPHPTCQHRPCNSAPHSLSQ